LTINRQSSLADVCFAVAGALEAHGIAAVLTGGSAATLYAPHVYASLDADFVLDRDEPLDEIAAALAPIGFRRNGRSRIFAHSKTEYTVDFPRGPLAVGGDYVYETASLTLGDTSLRILSRSDCIRDRLAHFYHWDDYTALNAAVGVAVASPVDVDMGTIRAWSAREGHIEKFSEFEHRLVQGHNT